MEGSAVGTDPDNGDYSRFDTNARVLGIVGFVLSPVIFMVSLALLAMHRHVHHVQARNFPFTVFVNLLIALYPLLMSFALFNVNSSCLLATFLQNFALFSGLFMTIYKILYLYVKFKIIRELANFSTRRSDNDLDRSDHCLSREDLDIKTQQNDGFNIIPSDDTLQDYENGYHTPPHAARTDSVRKSKADENQKHVHQNDFDRENENGDLYEGDNAVDIEKIETKAIETSEQLHDGNKNNESTDNAHLSQACDLNISSSGPNSRNTSQVRLVVDSTQSLQHHDRHRNKRKAVYELTFNQGIFTRNRFLIDIRYIIPIYLIFICLTMFPVVLLAFLEGEVYKFNAHLCMNNQLTAYIVIVGLILILMLIVMTFRLAVYIDESLSMKSELFWSAMIFLVGVCGYVGFHFGLSSFDSGVLPISILFIMLSCYSFIIVCTLWPLITRHQQSEVAHGRSTPIWVSLVTVISLRPLTDTTSLDSSSIKSSDSSPSLPISSVAGTGKASEDQLQSDEIGFRCIANAATVGEVADHSATATKSRAKIINNAVRLADVLANSEAHHLLKSFLVREFAVENILFLDAVRNFRDGMERRQKNLINVEKMCLMAKDIYENFLCPNSPSEVNISSRIDREKMRKEIEACIAHVALIRLRNQKDRIATEDLLSHKDWDEIGLPATLFDAANKEVHHLLEKDCFTRFRCTDEFQNWRKEMEATKK